MYSYFEKGYEQIYVQKDSAYTLLGKALKIADEIGDSESCLGILDHIIITADYHNDLPKFRITLEEVNTLLSDKNIAQKLQDAGSWNISYLIWLASYHFETMEYVKAKEFFLEAQGYFDEIPTEQLSVIHSEWLYTLYSSLGTTYMNLGNYELAELNYRRSIQLAKTSKSLKENVEAYITSANQSMAQLFTRFGKHDKAITYYIKNLNWSKKYYKEDNKYKYNLINAYQKITESYMAQDSLHKALFFLDESRPYLINDPFLNEALVLYGDIYLGLKNYEEAISHYNKALEFIMGKNSNQLNKGIAEVHGKIAELQLTQKEFQEGLQTMRKAFNVSGKNIEITDFERNPDPNEVFSKTQLLHLLDVKLQLLQGYFEETEEIAYQDVIRKTSIAILKTFDLLKSEFDSKLDKQFLAEKVYPIFHRMMEIAYRAYEKEPSDQTLQLALNIAEKNKDFILLEALRNAQATEYGEVPDQVLEKEAQLRAEITNLEKQLFDASETENVYSDALFNLKQEYYGFLDTIKIKYPKYHELKYDSRTLDLATVRNEVLDDDGTLISFSMAKNHLYAIIINGSNENFLKLPFNKNDREAIVTFNRLLSSPSVNGGEKKISDLAGQLFDKILKRALSDFDTENLTIIPDGELHYLPIDILKENGSYLLESKSIGYGNSITSLIALKNKQPASANRMLAFAPEFGNGTVQEKAEEQTRQFGKLIYNGDEVNGIERFYNASIFTDEKATLSSFMSEVSNANIIHLATHASANDAYPDYSYLAFSENEADKNDRILYIKDLYNMQLNADMVTLSACQTGIGKLQKGQGMLSLSKGFHYAGAKSLVNTLWKINDKSTVKLMEYFYEGLSKGKSKTKALREAKLRYLETTDDELLKHPYYWAAFVVSGDASALSTNNSHWWVLSLGLFTLLIIWLIFKKANPSKNK